jgi:hypothetical protein
MSLHSILLAMSLPGFALLIDPTAATGQAPASDTAAKAAPDSQRTLGDSGQNTDTAKATADTVKATTDTVAQRARPDSTPRSDTTRAPASSGTARTPTEPRDTPLSAACGGTAPVARDLLVVLFAPEAAARERAAAAKSVGGTLLGPAGAGEPDAYYLRVPAGGSEFQLRHASDQLILLPQVRQVGSRACPPPAPPETSRK